MRTITNNLPLLEFLQITIRPGMDWDDDGNTVDIDTPFRMAPALRTLSFGPRTGYIPECPFRQLASLELVWVPVVQKDVLPHASNLQELILYYGSFIQGHEIPLDPLTIPHLRRFRAPSTTFLLCFVLPSLEVLVLDYLGDDGAVAFLQFMRQSPNTQVGTLGLLADIEDDFPDLRMLLDRSPSITTLVLSSDNRRTLFPHLAVHVHPDDGLQALGEWVTHLVIRGHAGDRDTSYALEILVAIATRFYVPDDGPCLRLESVELDIDGLGIGVQEVFSQLKEDGLRVMRPYSCNSRLYQA
ncbi:hypothetical protein B0H11DRAFT_2252955 [Mycena galericulata]|nr:hypothetical protein B0H11DRAFT_2252955 [Mycena galericulata]